MDEYNHPPSLKSFGRASKKMKEYDHKSIEAKWQKIWAKKKVFEAKDPEFIGVNQRSNPRASASRKFYGLIEFPYPSGEGLHVGHPRPYIAMDVISRKRRMEGFNVLFPIGWDSFGLPTENYAIKTGIHPTIVTKKNIDTFRKQLKLIGYSFDWSREITTSDPKYYKWTQWIFLQLLKHGLAYKKKMPINWCPKDKIGLANEEVVDGKCERCGAQTEKRDKEQWMLAITKYADRLDRDLDPKKILIGTRNDAKVQMIKSCLSGVSGIELISLNDIPPIDDSTLQEGDDFKENARLKSEFYFKKTGIPTISTDHMLRIEKWPENGGFMVHIRKHSNPNSPRATDEEVLTFLKNFLKTVGGQSPANFHYAMSYTDENGTNGVDEVPHNYILQTEQAKNYWPGYPVEALLKDAETGLYKSEQSDDIRYIKIKNVLLEKFVPRMLAGVTPIDYQEKIRVQQKNWIGRSEGVNLRFKVKDLGINFEMYDSIPQTHMAQTFTVIAPEHPQLFELVKGTEFERPVMEKAKEMIKKREGGVYEKTGEMDGIFTGRFVEYSPAKRDLPIWVASFVVADYGTGVVNCSFHDERDYAFAKKFNIPLHPVLFPKDQVLAEKVRKQEIFYREADGILEEPTEFKGRRWDESREDTVNYLVKNGWAKRAVNYKLRDWVFSRQHYWGEPIPVVFCEKCAKRKPKFLFLHCYRGNSKEDFWPWLKGKVEKSGFEVFAPNLPGGENPKFEEQADFLLKNYNFDENTIIVTHSLSGVLAMKLLETGKISINKLIMAAPPLKTAFKDNKPRPGLDNFCDWKFNFRKIKKYVREVVVIIDKEDKIVPIEQPREIAQNLNAKMIEVVAPKPHFDCEKADAILENVLTYDILNPGIVPIPEKDLPIELPKVEKYLPTDTGESPLAGIKNFVDTQCPQCGGHAKRETDTMPNWAGSSWYYLAYIMRDKLKVKSKKSKVSLIDYENQFKYWSGISKDFKLSTLNFQLSAGPVDWYNGGMEHTTLHLLYSRFWHKFLFDIGVVPTSEPYKKRTSHGLILAEGGVKMSKSKGNVINPDDLVERFGADALRVYEMFMGPFDQAIAWSTDGLVGTRRFLEKVWRIGEKVQSQKLKVKSEDNNSSLLTTNYSLLTNIVHKTVKKVGEDIEAMRFNTAISSLMICANEMDSATEVPKELFEMFLKILSPFAPHIAEELWSQMRGSTQIKETQINADEISVHQRNYQRASAFRSICLEPWPIFDPSKIVDNEVTIVVQINGKVRGQFSATPDISEQEAIEKAKSLPEIQKWTEGKEIKKAIFVKGRLVNLVI